ncbi:MAG: C25 family cysteine peptidase, partial [Bacteroidales bacterium]|nr:C25 family cysteine peptidase [Bacteroidales bacterium]
MKKSITIVITFILGSIVNALNSQPYGSEWINYNQKYFRIPISKTGIYRINRQTLVQAGFPVNNISPKNIQLFARGKEQYIYIHGEDDGVFNNTDYIEFFAEANNGWFDSLMYEQPNQITNPYYSLINDTIYYFLTWNNSQNNRRVLYEVDTAFAAYSQAIHPYCYVEKLFIRPEVYYYGEVGCWYNKAEGWATNFADINNPLIINIPTPNFANVNEPVKISFCVLGVSNASYIGAGNHHLKISLNNTSIFDTIYNGLNRIEKQLSLNFSLSATSSLKLESVNDLLINTDKQALSYFKILYPHQMSFNFARYSFFLQNHSVYNKSYVQFQAPSTAKILLWDVSNHKKIYVKYESGLHKALIPNGNVSEKWLYYCYEDSVYNATVMPGMYYSRYVDLAQQADYIIITHSSLYSVANSYATYRNSSGYQTLMVDIAQLYDKYAYGIPKHPLSIHNFIRALYAQYQYKIKHFLLIGKGIHSEMCRQNVQYYSQNLIPTYGTPPSDQFYTAGLMGDIPKYSIGRIAASNLMDVNIYLNKVIQY